MLFTFLSLLEVLVTWLITSSELLIKKRDLMGYKSTQISNFVSFKAILSWLPTCQPTNVYLIMYVYNYQCIPTGIHCKHVSNKVYLSLMCHELLNRITIKNYLIWYPAWVYSKPRHVWLKFGDGNYPAAPPSDMKLARVPYWIYIIGISQRSVPDLLTGIVHTGHWFKVTW